MENQELSIELPVVELPNEAKPANESLFTRARNKLPLPMNEAKSLKKLWAAASVDKVKPGAKFQVAVVLEIEGPPAPELEQAPDRGAHSDRGLQ